MHNELDRFKKETYHGLVDVTSRNFLAGTEEKREISVRKADV
jgi:hypothetical protein